MEVNTSNICFLSSFERSHLTRELVFIPLSNDSAVAVIALIGSDGKMANTPIFAPLPEQSYGPCLS